MKYTGMLVPDGRGRLLVMYSKTNNMWTVPGGKLNLGESHMEAAVRELEEETGIRCLECHLIHRGIGTFGGEDHDMSLFKATRWLGYPSLKEPDKHMDLRFLGSEDLAGLRLEKSILLRIAERSNNGRSG